MEDRVERFQTFIDTLDPYQFLETGNDGIESLPLILPSKLHLITSQHISVLIKIIFLQNLDTSTAFPFFAGSLLHSLTEYLGDKFTDMELISETFDLIEQTHLNLTICGYFSQFFKPLLSKRNKIIIKVLENNEMCSILLSNVQSSEIGSIVKDCIENFPEYNKSILQRLVSTVYSGHVLLSGPSSEILIKTLKQLTPNTTSQIFSESAIKALLHSPNTHLKYSLKTITELLLLPKANHTKSLTLRVLSENLPHVSHISYQCPNENLIDIIKIMRLSINSDFGILPYQIGSSDFIKIATKRFFASMWNSQLHLRYFELVESAINSKSNSLISSIFESGLLEQLIEQAQKPTVKRGKVSVRKGFMGFVTKIGLVLRDSKNDTVKNYLRILNRWEEFLIYINAQEAIEEKVLGGRQRYRHMTSDEIMEYSMLDKNETEDKIENFYNKKYWEVPACGFDEELYMN